MQAELTKISQVNDNLFLSGIFPLDQDHSIIKKLDIKYIVVCLYRNDIAEIHDKIMINNPGITILYLPYDDDIKQNLWKTNKNEINILKYSSSMDDYNKLTNLLNFYNNKPMIEIGYHFIDTAVEEGNKILVHCMAGVSRSVSLVTYYLMKKNCSDFDKTLESVKQKRSIANPNSSFATQLRTYHRKRELFTENDAKEIIRNYS